MNKFIESIDKQIEFNQGINVILDEPELFKFIDDTVNTISSINDLNTDLENFLIDYATDKVLDEFCRINQYYSFNSESKNALRCIYADLFNEILYKKEPIGEISKNHFLRLKKWLIKFNSFAATTYSNAEQRVKPVVCAEYSYDLQIDILKIDVNRLVSPVLDIGCGKQGNLVNYPKSKEIEVFGIDRFKFDSDILHTFDWLEYDNFKFLINDNVYELPIGKTRKEINSNFNAVEYTDIELSDSEIEIFNKIAFAKTPIKYRISGVKKIDLKLYENDYIKNIVELYYLLTNKE